MSKAQMGRTATAETREKLRIAQTGKKVSIETRLKMSESRLRNQNAKGYKHTEETKAKMRATRQLKRFQMITLGV